MTVCELRSDYQIGALLTAAPSNSLIRGMWEELKVSSLEVEAESEVSAPVPMPVLRAVAKATKAPRILRSRATRPAWGATLFVRQFQPVIDAKPHAVPRAKLVGLRGEAKPIRRSINP